MKRWTWQIRQDGLTVAKGFSTDKETATTEVMHYASQYLSEDYSIMTITIRELEK